MDVEKFVEQYSVERKGTACHKWDGMDEMFGDNDLLAMWVADMEFKIAECVQKALYERIDHGVFGYSQTPNSYYDAFIGWQRRRIHATIEKDWIRFTPGVVAFLYWAVAAYTKENDKILVQPPVYYPFFNAIKDNNRQVVASNLIQDENGRYIMDLVDFEEKIKQENVKMFILCSPHNPVGRVWTEQELNDVLAICQKYNVIVLSDEIHQDIIVGDNPFISSISVNNGAYHKNLLIATAPSKTFNLAGLQHSNIIIPTPELREIYDVKIQNLQHAGSNVLAKVATEAAYNGCEAWLEGLLATIKQNFNYVKESLRQHAPKAVVADLEGTYLTWIDMSAYIEPEKIKEFIQDTCRIAVDFGEWFSDDYKGFIRLNLGTTPANVKTAIESIITNLKTWEN